MDDATVPSRPPIAFDAPVLNECSIINAFFEGSSAWKHVLANWYLQELLPVKPNRVLKDLNSLKTGEQGSAV